MKYVFVYESWEDYLYWQKTESIAEGYSDKDIDIKNINTFDIIKRLSKNDKKR